jgi:uncharacterized protein involved in outer membrane biogenesis
MKVPYKLREMGRLQKLFLAVAAVFGLYSIIGFLLFPFIVKSISTKLLSERLHRKVSIAGIGVNPYVLSLRVKGLTVQQLQSSDPFAAFDTLYLNLQAVSLFKWGLVIKDLELDKPYLKVIRTATNQYNFSDLLQNGEAGKKKGQASLSRFSVNNVRISNGELDIKDIPKDKVHKVTHIRLNIPRISDFPVDVEVWVKPAFSAEINGSPISFNGEAKPFSSGHHSILNVAIKDVDIPRYLPYLPRDLKFNIPKGTLSLDTKLEYSQAEKAGAPSLNITGGVQLKDFEALDEKGLSLVKLTELDIHIASFEPFSKKLHLAKIYFHPFQLNLRRDKGGRINLTSLPAIRRMASSPPGQGKGERPLAVTIDEIEVKNGRLSFTDFSLEEPFTTTIDPIDATVKHFANKPDSKASLKISAHTGNGAALDLSGEFSIQPVRVSGKLHLRDMPLDSFSPYFQKRILFKVDKALLDLDTDYRWANVQGNLGMALSHLSASLKSLKLRKENEGEPFVRIPSLSVSDVDFDLAEMDLTIPKLVSREGEISIKRNQNGEFNLQNLFPSPAKEGPVTQAQGHTEKTSWHVKLKEGLFEGYTVLVSDRKPAKPLNMTLAKLSLHVEDLSREENQKGSLSFSCVLNEKGHLSAKGSIGVSPAYGNLKLDLEGIEVMPLENYLPPYVKVRLKSGSLSASGNLLAGYSKDHNVTVHYLGDASLSDFVSTEKEGKQDLIRWKDLQLKGIDAQNSPSRLGIREVGLKDLFALVTIHSDGKLNLLEDLAPEKESKSKGLALPPGERAKVGTARVEPGVEPQAETLQRPTAKGHSSQPPALEVDKVILEAGRIDFSDSRVQPPLQADLTDLGGTVLGLSSETGTQAEVNLQGRLFGDSPLEIKGKVSPLSEDLFVKVNVRLKNMGLTPMNPYAEKYIGYSIEKGKLFLDLRYLIVKRKLDSQNGFLLDQLTLGNEVKSPDAIDVPIKFVIALLKNTEGQIKLDIPVTGNINDPKFSLGDVILKTIRSFVFKAMTSPFAILGSIFGGGEELRYVVFPYGSSVLTKKAEGKLATLINALHDRPGLKLDIAGYVDVQKDRKALEEEQFLKKLKAEKLKELMEKGEGNVSLDQVTIGSEEYGKYLRMAYDELSSEKKVQSKEKQTLSEAEMKKAVLATIKVTDADLRLLAQRREQRVEKDILDSGKVKPERVYLVSPNSLLPPKEGDLKASRVVMTLK